MIDVLGTEKRRTAYYTGKDCYCSAEFEPGMICLPGCPATRCGSQPVISLAQSNTGEEVLLLWPQESRSFCLEPAAMKQIKELSACSAKRWKMNSLKKPLNTACKSG